MGDEGEKELHALCKLFIGGIPHSIEDSDLREEFLKYTEDNDLNDCVVIKDSNTKKSRGFGFVTYNKLSDADTCLANRPHVLAGKEVEVKHAIPRDDPNPMNHTRTNKIFVGGFPAQATEEDTKEAIENYTLAVGENLNVTVEKVDIIPAKGPSQQPRGFCFVEMASEDDADKVVIVKHFDIKGKTVELKKAEPKGSKGGGGGGMQGGGRGARRGGGRDFNRSGGGAMGQYGGGGGWGGVDYGGGFDQQYMFGSPGRYDQYGGAGSAYGGNYGQYYSQVQSTFGPSRLSNRGHNYRPY